MPSAWLTKSLGVITVLSLFSPIVTAEPGIRKAASPDYQGRDACPVRCSNAGPSPTSWSVYHNFDQFQSCPQTLFYQFSIYDQVDDPNTLHRIYACTSYGPDFANLPKSSTKAAAIVDTVEANYELGWWSEGGKADVAGISTLSKQMREYLSNGHGAATQDVVLFGQASRAAVGLYIGKGLQNEGVGTFALKAVEDALQNLDANATSLAIQLCKPGYGGDHIFGLMATSNATFASVQNALQTWSNGTCLSFAESMNITGRAMFTTPLAASDTSTFGSSLGLREWSAELSTRDHCRTIQVGSGDSCGALAKRCKITGAAFTKYNPQKNFCAALKPQQHVCCSSGTLPDFTPKPNKDGSCATYSVKAGDSCSTIAASHSITSKALGSFNLKTWAWNGCSNIWTGSKICVSKGTPPMPAPVANAVCGPQKPGTKAPKDMSNIAKLNPCPLNACCDVWGKCGITSDFCTSTSTGAPGTAKPGTNGCISNCGTKIVQSSAPSTFRSVAYFEGFGLSRTCLFQDALQIDGSKYTNLHFAFGTIKADYSISTGDAFNTYEFQNFRRISGPKKILSFGGWDFSTGPHTYMIFRQGVTPAHRLKLATNIANFIKKHKLDGVDIDWEYPSVSIGKKTRKPIFKINSNQVYPRWQAPDIPGIPAGSKDEGANYLAFLVVLKSLLPGKSVSIAAPSSYWYLKGFPIKEISKVVDYIVYMTYDLHGQWDSLNQNSQLGCPSGMCLRSQVNLTETMTSLAMITKAGVPSNRVVVGVTSYGRSFAMAKAGCHTPNCLFTGSPSKSNAKKGICTNTAGYISNAEISAIINTPSRINQNYLDATSNTNILVYDNTQWVAWMGPKTKASRATLYRSLNMGGTSDWATDLERYNDVPKQAKSWADFKLNVKAGMDPYQVGKRHGNWTSVTCTDQGVEDLRDLTPSQRWGMLDCSDAWNDAVNVWKTVDKPARRISFSQSISNTLHGPEDSECGNLKADTNCANTVQCNDFVGSGTGAAAYEVWNSLIQIHEMYANFHEALYKAAGSIIDNALVDFETKFAPVPPPPDHRWVLLLVDLITLGTAMIAAPFFHSVMSTLPYFAANDAAFNTLRDSTMTMISQSTTIAKDLMGSTTGKKWTEAKQDEFSTYMGQTISIWGNVTEEAVKGLFNGLPDSIDQLTTLISDGKLIAGKGNLAPDDSDDTTEAALEESISKAFFGYAIPVIWSLSGTYPFIIDSGYDCGVVDPLGAYLDTATMHKTTGCYGGKLYYLASPKGAAKKCHNTCSPHCENVCVDNTFSAPPGIEWLDGTTYGGITIHDLIAGSVRTYNQNGGTNGGASASPGNDGTLTDLMDQDVTTPGYIRIPVCSPDLAFRSWNGPGKPEDQANYPCGISLGKSDCSDTTFLDQTSKASPSITDCRHIITNIEGTSGEWELESATNNQHEIVNFGSCKFGVQTHAGKGNINYHVGAQDIIDIINDSIKKFSANGKVGATGQMSCRGDTATAQAVTWGLY
ncbi:hypothetical protein G7046_g2225 [Stylonectria norvegica]|nr:hypothetical protein G7046_g2225 [Stylonectria norvegica]